MALSITQNATHPSPEVVGRAFAEQYYHVFHHSPSMVHKFYHDSSTLTRPNSEGEMTSVTTLHDINNLFMSLDTQNYIVELASADCQSSFKDGVFILVMGTMKSTADGICQKFSQSFFLAPQEKEGAYFVLNDVFRYVNSDKPNGSEQVLVNGSDVVAAPVTPDQDPELLQDHHAVESASHPSEADMENGNAESENGGSVFEGETVMDEQAHATQTDAPLVSEPTALVSQEDVPKKSYASIVKFTKGSIPAVPVYVPTTKSRTTTVKIEKPSTISTESVVTLKSAPTPETPDVSNNDVVEKNSHDVEGHSVYIKNLPLNATAAQVEEEFKKFGSIKPGGVQVRSHKIDNFCFGFVEFELLASMQAAIEASPVTIGDRQVFVEEKKTTTRVVNGVVKIGTGNGRGRYAPGRGGFRNDNFRGRGGYGHNQNFVRIDFRNRTDYPNRGEYSNHSRGQAMRGGEAYQRVQNWSGRGGRPNNVDQAAAVSA